MSEMEQGQGQPDELELRYGLKKPSETTESVYWLQYLKESLEGVDYDWRNVYDNMENWPHPVRKADREKIEAAASKVGASLRELVMAAFYYIYLEERTNPDNEGEWDAAR